MATSHAGERLEDVVKRADTVMYAAKRDYTPSEASTGASAPIEIAACAVSSQP
jgi:hypothetical protein